MFLWIALLIAIPAFGHGDHGNSPMPAEHLLPLPDQAIALVALGLAMARLESDTGALPLWTLVIAVASGVAAGLRLPPGEMALARALPQILIGLTLIDLWSKSKEWPRAFIAVAGVAAGLSYGATLAHGAPLLVHVGFFVSIAVMPAVIASTIWRRFYHPGFRIALKIAGSWMTAIGTILLGAALR